MNSRFLSSDVSTKAYSPFGEQLNDNSTGFGYNGEYYNAATGMIYLRARFYDPEMNRFSQKDILRGSVTDALSLNRYLYCQNDPVNFIDPSGMTLKSAISKAVNNVTAKVSNTYNSVKTTVTNTYNTVKTAATNTYNTVKTGVTNTYNTVKTAVTNTYNTIKTGVVNTYNEVKTDVVNAYNSAKSTVENWFTPKVDTTQPENDGQTGTGLKKAQPIYNHSEDSDGGGGGTHTETPGYYDFSQPGSLKEFIREKTNCGKTGNIFSININKLGGGGSKVLDYLGTSVKGLVLGSYSDKQTLLSIAGSVALGIAGVDLIMDIRDLSYDISHWGQEEHFGLILALDLIAFIPVVGSLKYADEVVDAVKRADDVIDVIKQSDAVSDIAKHADDVIDIFKQSDGASDIVKHFDDVDDVLKNTDDMGDIVKQADNIVDVGEINIGEKLEYVFGNATGSKHNIERSLDMENKLNEIGIFDNVEGRIFMENELQKAFNDTTNGIVQENGRMMKESLLVGPNGIAKMQSIWDGNKLITVEIFKSN